MNVMIDNLDAIEPRETRQIELSNDNIEMLLFDFLQELIYFKDASVFYCEPARRKSTRKTKNIF